MVLLGGFASFFGPLVGAFAFIFLQDTVMSVFPYWRLIFGAMLAFIVIFAPGGLMGLFARRATGRGLARGDPRGARRSGSATGPTWRSTASASASREGEFVSIIGPNGAGKSTLINVLTGVLAPSAGRVRFKGRDIGGIGPVALARARHGPELPARPDLPRPHRARDAAGRGGLAARARQPALRLAPARDRQVQAEALEVADPLRSRRPGPLAGARAAPGRQEAARRGLRLRAAPEIILLDEPTSGVSTADKHAIMEILVARPGASASARSSRSSTTWTSCSATRTGIIALHQGKVLADATPAAIRADARVVDMVDRARQRR